MIEGSNIQVEDGGYTRVHNAILETLSKANLSGLEFAIVLFIIRKTYGFQKTMDVISITQFESLGYSRRKTIQAIQNLLRLRVIKRNPIGFSFEYGFNKYIEDWLPEVFVSRRAGNGCHFHKQKPVGSAQMVTSDPIDTRGSDLIDTKTSDLIDTHKRNKESIKEKEPSQHKLIFGALARICKVDPKLKSGQISRTAKKLQDAGYLVTDLEYFERWWKEKDFRGQRGDPPTIGQVADKIMQAVGDKKPKPPPDAPTTQRIMVPFVGIQEVRR